MKMLPVFLIFVTALANAELDCDKAIHDQDLKTCASLEFKTSDKKLNELYGSLNKLLDAEGQRKLRDTQRAWIKFRDSNAEFSGDIFRGGSAESLNILGTKTSMTMERVKELEAEVEIRR
jgi:uncharacterized protein YecT (DUF1311 family)